MGFLASSPLLVFAVSLATLGRAQWISSPNLDAQEYPLALDLGPDARLFWRFHANNTIIELAVRVKGTGWVGLGIGSASMHDSDMLIAGVDSGPYAHDTWSETESQPTLDTNRGGKDDLLESSALEEDGVTVVKFVRLLDTGDASDNPIILGRASDLGAAFHSSSDNWAREHSWYGYYSINWENGALGVPQSSAGTAHGVLMYLAWGLFVPIATFLPAFFKHIGHRWYQLHMFLNVSGFLLSFIALFVAVAAFGVDSPHATPTVHPHHVFGLITLVLLVLQPAIGLYANKVYNPRRSSVPLWPDRIHAYLGRFALLTANIAMLLAFSFYAVPGIIVCYAISSLGLLATSIALKVRNLANATDAPSHKFAHLDDDDAEGIDTL